MNVITNPDVSLKTVLKTGGSTGVYSNVVQKGHVGSSYVYAMQLHKDVNSVLRARPAAAPTATTFGPSILRMHNLASGHSQTWEYSGKKGCWFIGTKGVKPDGGKYAWATQIARVSVPPTNINHYSNTDFPRLSHLNLAGGFNIDLLRSEAAVSPDYTYFLVATIDQNDNGYFSLYYLNDVNQALDDAGTSPYNISNLTPVQKFKPFMISDMTKGYMIGSFKVMTLMKTSIFIFLVNYLQKLVDHQKNGIFIKFHGA